MKTLRLELQLTPQTRIWVTLRSDNTISTAWQENPFVAPYFRKWTVERRNWLRARAWDRLVPVVDAAFEALKENADGLHRP